MEQKREVQSIRDRDPGQPRVAASSGKSGRLSFRAKLYIILGGILAVVLIAPPVTYGIWQWQARRAVVALGQDNRAFIETTVPQEMQGGEGDAGTPDASPAPFPQPGTLRIANANIAMPIFESKSERALFAGAWRAPQSGSPDTGGNTVIFGHRFLKLPPSDNTLFNLHKVSEGDVFEIDWEGETYRYRVAKTWVVQPTDLSVLEETDEPTITLVTCAPLFSTRERLIVRAELLQ